MAKRNWGLKLKRDIVINYAKRLHSKYSLTLPVDLEMIASEYAELRYLPIPFEIDGVSVNLKKTGIRPTIIVNNKRPKKRQRFTLAHEIGHVLIPWHMGTIFDITENKSSNGVEYWEMESEANAFATELLMPSCWVQELIAVNEDVAKVNEEIMKQADVSAIAATLRLRSKLPPGYVFLFLDSEEIVTYSGRTKGTHVDAATVGKYCDLKKKYPHAQCIYEFETYWERCIWVKMQDEMPLPVIKYRPWREVLEEMLEGASDDVSVRNKLKSQLNGVLGYANGFVKRGEFFEETLFAACMQRLSSKDHLKILIDHPLFPEFLTSKIKDLISKEMH